VLIEMATGAAGATTGAPATGPAGAVETTVDESAPLRPGVADALQPHIANSSNPGPERLIRCNSEEAAMPITSEPKSF
jgi:hypothetical protein